MQAHESSLRFERYEGPCWVVDRKVPDLAADYDSAFVRTLCERHGPAGDHQVHHGSRARRPSIGRVDPGFAQDVVISRKQ
jgi:hypothetical protein